VFKRGHRNKYSNQMRLKGEINQTKVSDLMVAISKGSLISSEDTFCMQFDPDFLTIGFKSTSNPEVWLKLTNSQIFLSDFICTSVRQNVIQLLVPSLEFIETLKFINKMKKTLFKLSRSESNLHPILFFECRYFLDSEVFVVFRSLPVQVIRNSVDFPTEPALEPPSIKIELLGLSRIRLALDKLKNLKLPSVELKAKNEGTLEITGMTDDAEVTLFLSNLNVVSDQSLAFPQNNGDNGFTVYVSANFLQKSVSAISQLTMSAPPIFMLNPDYYLCIWSQLDDQIGFFTTIIPAMTPVM
jgi:Hus1-like protein